MSFDELSKILFCFGFDKGIRNVRQKQELGYRINAFFKDDEEITNLYLSVLLGKMNESVWSMTLSIDSKEQLENSLEKLLPSIRYEVHQFQDNMNNLKFKV